MICKKVVKYFIFVLIAASAAAEESPDIPIQQKLNKSAFKKSLFKDCAKSYSLTCLKLDIVSWVDKLDENEDFSILPGISVVKENVSDSVSTKEVLAEVGREFPSDPNARVDAYLTRKVLGYFNTHSIKFNFGNQGGDEPNSAGGAASPRKGGGGGGLGGGKGGGGLAYLLAAGGMMKGTLMAIAMGGLAAMAGKALMAAMMSLMMSAIVGLKGMSHGGDHKESYEVIAKPIDHHYRRSYDGLY